MTKHSDNPRIIANNKPKIDHIIRKLFQNAQTIRHIEHGYENHIVLVDNKFVIRFPRNEAVWERSKLERYILSQLDSPLVQSVISYNDNPAYSVLTYLPGQNISESDFGQLPIVQQQKIGSQIAKFAHTLHTTLNVEDFKKESNKLKAQVDSGGTYAEHLREMLHDFTFPTPEQDKIAKQFYKSWLAIKPSKPVVVHDDLHVDNLLFENNELSGVIDFAATCVGTVEQELRQVYRLSDAALTSAAETYEQLAGTPVDIQAARIWAITQELATYARCHYNPENPAFQRAQAHLKLWFSEVF